ncbi:MAG: hypothetical protein DRO05_05145 [Thermoproteota archaeon]|nr:MAG: hypothetical protein DRO05_05145 [Candidatus Korarchaeota archaeon]
MRGMKVLRTSLLSIFLIFIFYSLSGQVMGGTVKGSVLKPAAKQGMKKVPPAASHPGIKKKVVPIAKAAPDLSIERIYLKGCNIHVVIKNVGSGGLTQSEYDKGQLLLKTKDKEHIFALKDVDKRGLLKKGGGVADFDTGVRCAEREKVEAYLKGLKGEKGRKRLSALLIPSGICIKKGVARKLVASSALGKEKHVTRSTKMLRRTPRLVKKEVLPMTGGGLPEDLSLSEISFPSWVPLRLKRITPQPEGAIYALMFCQTWRGTCSSVVTRREYGVDPNISEWFQINWDIEKLREEEQRIGNIPVKVLDKIKTRMVYIEPNGQEHLIYDLTREGDYRPFKFKSQDVLDKLRDAGLLKWDQLAYDFRIEGEAVYRLLLQTGRPGSPLGGSAGGQRSSGETTKPLNRVYVTWYLRGGEGGGTRLGAPILRPRITIEEVKTLWDGVASASAPSQRVVKFRVSVKNEGNKSTDRSLTPRGTDAASQNIEAGKFWVSVFREYHSFGGYANEQIASFLVGPLAPEEEWTSPTINDVSDPEYGVTYRVLADAVDFIREEVETLNENYIVFYEYWDKLADEGEVDVKITSISIDPPQVRVGQQATILVRIANHSSMNVPVLFGLQQPANRDGSGVCRSTPNLPFMLHPGENTVSLNLGPEGFMVPGEGEIGLWVSVFRVYFRNDLGFVGYGTWDEKIKDFSEVFSGLYSMTEVAPFISILGPRAGGYYVTKTTGYNPPPTIMWWAYDPTGDVRGDVELYYRIKERGVWTGWRRIARVPVTPSVYEWEPDIAIGERETQILAKWIKPEDSGTRELTDVSGTFTIDFQSDYDAYGIEITDPKATTVWTKGQSATIRWRVDPQKYSCIGIINLVRLDESGNPTGDWVRVVQDIQIENPTGSYDWVVPQEIDSGNYVIEIYPEGSGYLGGGRKLWSEVFKIQ